MNRPRRVADAPRLVYVEKIRILPMFITPAVLNVLVEKFNIAPTTTVEADLAQCLAK